MVYLDNAATMPLLPSVREAMRKAEDLYFANASALHTPGHRALSEVEKCREVLAEMVGAEPDEIIFTSGATESNNTVIRTFEGCQIECSPLEHHSVLETARICRGDKLPKLYSYMLVNNETGEYVLETQLGDLRAWRLTRSQSAVSPVTTGANEDVSKSPDCVSEYFHSDLTQALGKVPIDVRELGLDYATFSAHKIGGPVGVGALYVREGAPFKPLMIGGNQEKKRRGGTYNTVGIAGFRAALEYVRDNKTWEVYDTRVRELRDRLAERILAEIPGSSLNTDIARGRSLPNILNMSFAGAEGESIQLYLDAEGIIVSTGSACAAGDTKPSHVLMAKTGDVEIAHSSIRFSFGVNNTTSDVERVMEVLPGIIKKLQGISTVERSENE